jgi:hypothetical protein
MDLPVEIVVRGTTLAPEDDALIRRCASRLSAFGEGTLACRVCRVTVRAQPPQRGGAPEYTVQIHLVLPAGEIAVAERASGVRFTVIQEALDAAGRQLHGHAARYRHPMQR